MEGAPSGGRGASIHSTPALPSRQATHPIPGPHHLAPHLHLVHTPSTQLQAIKPFAPASAAALSLIFAVDLPSPTGLSEALTSRCRVSSATSTSLSGSMGVSLSVRVLELGMSCEARSRTKEAVELLSSAGLFKGPAGFRPAWRAAWPAAERETAGKTRRCQPAESGLWRCSLLSRSAVR